MIMSTEFPLTPEGLAQELFNAHPPLMTPVPEAESGIVTDILYSRLPDGFDSRLVAILKDHGRDDFVSRLEWLRPFDREYRRAVLTYGAAYCSAETRTLAGISAENPPADVHSMARAEIFAGDFYNCDMISQALRTVGIDIEQCGVYLDFGASSGRVVRNMRAAYPQATWQACDPQEKSIDWAKHHLDPEIRFFVSPLSPPLPNIPDGYFDGVYAISIWSHFSEHAALSWFAEMHRCIKPGGWLMFTTHGANTLRHYAQDALKPDDQIRAIYSALLRDGYIFEDVFGPSGDWSVASVDWGMCYMLPSWVALNLVGKGWSMNLVEIGRNALNQDNYLLVRNAP
jgi:SAM-dependent methyltransferase